MSPARFIELLRSRGPALQNWPEADRRAARRLLATSRRCRRAYLAALATDSSLEARVDPAVLSRLAAGVRNRMPAGPSAAAPKPFGRLWRSPAGWAALAACGLLGAWVGWHEPPLPQTPFLLAAAQITPLDGDPLDPAP